MDLLLLVGRNAAQKIAPTHLVDQVLKLDVDLLYLPIQLLLLSLATIDGLLDASQVGLCH